MTTNKLIWKPLKNGRGYYAKGLYQYKIYKMVTDEIKLRFECYIAVYHNDFFLQEVKNSLKQAKKFCSKTEADINKYLINLKLQEVTNDN